MHHPTDRIIHTTAFVTPVMEHWLEREIAQSFNPRRIDPTTHRTMSERSYQHIKDSSLPEVASEFLLTLLVKRKKQYALVVVI